jgi:hypothetical protein
MQRKKLSVIGLSPLFLAVAGGCDGTATSLESGVEQNVAPLSADNGFGVNGFGVNGFGINGFGINGFGINGFGINGLSANGLSANGISINGISLNGFAVNGFSLNGLSVNGFVVNGLSVNGAPRKITDPAVSELVSYLVSCALPEDDSVSYSVDGQSVTFAGDIGLAPQWKDGACDGDCQRWITACLLSRVNYNGEHVKISMRGEHRALKLEPHEQRDYADREAAYYGNAFQGRAQVFACYAPGTPSIPRVCGDSLDNCPMIVTGPCDRACLNTGRHGTFQDCGADAPVSRRDRLYEEVITVFLRGDR